MKIKKFMEENFGFDPDTASLKVHDLYETVNNHMRVNDAVHAGLPAVVSDGMGASWLVEQFGCGGVYPAGDASALAKTLERFAADGNFRARLSSGVAAARKAWTPEARAKVWLEEVLGA